MFLFVCVICISVEIERSHSENTSLDSCQLDDISTVCYECPIESTALSVHQSIQGLATTSCLNCKFLTSQVAQLKEKCDKLINEKKQLRSRKKAVVRKLLNSSRSKLSCNSAVRKCMNVDQLKALSNKSTRGMKWSINTIIKCLKLHFFCGLTGYGELLAQGYPLPSRRTLLRSIQHSAFESGVLTDVFKYLSIKVRSMLPEERQCVLTLDEMSITASVELDNRSGRFSGDVSLPGHSGVATHSMVFML